MSVFSIRHVVAGAVLASAVLMAGCDRTGVPVPGADEATPTQPVAAVEQLIDDLHRKDLVAYARHAVPPALHGRLGSAWSEGRTLWPLTELPLDAKFQGFLIALAAPGSEQKLLAAYRKQFAGANTELRTAATTLGLFATQYVNQASTYSDAERDHYAQMIAALRRWGQRAPLGDTAHARRAVPQLALAARATGLGVVDGLRSTGMEHSLQRLGPFLARLTSVLRGYGLDFDAALMSARVSLAEQTGDRARVRLRYTLAGQPIDAYVLLERQQGRWYLSDLLRRAEAEAEAASGAVPD